VYLLYLLSTRPKMVHDSSGGREPQVENHWFILNSCRVSPIFKTQLHSPDVFKLCSPSHLTPVEVLVCVKSLFGVRVKTELTSWNLFHIDENSLFNPEIARRSALDDVTNAMSLRQMHQTKQAVRAEQLRLTPRT